MSAPTPPPGVAAQTPGIKGCVAEWRHTNAVPYLEARLYNPRPESRTPRGKVLAESRPASVDIATGPIMSGLSGVTDPGVLRQCCRLLEGAADWLEAQTAAAPAEVQTSIFDEVAS